MAAPGHVPALRHEARLDAVEPVPLPRRGRSESVPAAGRPEGPGRRASPSRAQTARAGPGLGRPMTADRDRTAGWGGVEWVGGWWGLLLLGRVRGRGRRTLLFRSQSLQVEGAAFHFLGCGRWRGYRRKRGGSSSFGPFASVAEAMMLLPQKQIESRGCRRGAEGNREDSREREGGRTGGLTL